MLVKYELLKILRKKSTLLIMAVSLILTAFLFGLPAVQYQTYDQDGVMKGMEGIAFEKQQYARLSVSLSEEYITKTIREVQKLFESPDNVGYDGKETFLIGDAYWKGIAPREKLLRFIAGTYSKPNESLGYDSLRQLDITKGAFFYQKMAEKREALLLDPARALSKEQKEYWSRMAHKVKTPLQYGYYGGWEVIISCFEILMFALLAICIVIAPVFSGEYQAGTDAVILAARYGKTKLVAAKIAAALLFGTAAFVLHVLTACVLPLAAFGAEGWNLPIAIANSTIPYPFTFLQAVLVNIGVIYLVLLAMMSLTLFLSAKMKSPYQVLVVLIPIFLIPIFLTPGNTAGIYNLILFLLPYRCAMPEFGKYISYQFGGAVFDVLTVRAVLYLLITMLILPLARTTFKKHQVA
ncbi:ABC transporter permease [Lachnospiraceae bacterium]|nr:ABC transporter permease [Lachnospiraceae bacterium]